MSIRIPLASREVQTQTPTVPQARQPRVVRQSFGEDVARANQQLGAVGSNIGEALMRHEAEKYKIEQDVIEANTLTRLDLNNYKILNNEEPEEVNVDGTKIRRKKGIVSRELGSARGGTIEYDEKISNELNNALMSIDDPETRARVAYRASKMVNSSRNEVIKHEVTQDRKDKENAFNASIKLATDKAYSSRTSDDVGVQLESAIIASQSKNRLFDLDPESAHVNVKESVKGVLKSAIVGNLKTDMTGTTSLNILNRFKDHIPEDLYIGLKSEIKVGTKHLQEQQKQANAAQLVSNRFDYLGKVANGEIDWSNADNEVRTIAGSDPDLAEAVNRVVKSGGQYFPSEMNDLFYMDMVKNVFAAPDKESVSNFLVQTLKGSGGKISKERLSILVSAAKEQAAAAEGDLVAQENVGIMKSSTDSFGAGSAGDFLPAFKMAWDMLKNRYGKGLNGSKLKKAADATLRNAAIEKVPAIGTMPTVPNKIIQEDGTVSTIHNSFIPITIGDDEPATSDQSPE